MKKLEKINILLTFILTTIILIILINTFLIQKKDFRNSTDYINRLYENCINQSEPDDYCNYIIKNYNNKEKMTPDTISLYMYTLISPNISYLNYAIPPIIIFISMIFVCQIFKSKEVINILNRMDYKNFLKKLIKGVYKYALILPFIALVIMSLSYVYSGHFDPSYAKHIGIYTSFWIHKPALIFILCYLISLFLFAIFYINLGLIVARKNHFIITVLLESFLLYIGVDLVMEVISCLPAIFGAPYSSANIINVFTVSYAKNTILMVLIPLVLAILSFGIVILRYKDKEKLIIDCEKNN